MKLAKRTTLMGSLFALGWTMAAVSGVGLSACADDEDPRKEVLRYLATAGTQSAVDLAAEAVELEEAARALCTMPTLAALDSAQERWRAARAAWGRHLAFSLGPAREQRLALDFWPVRIDSIEAAIDAAPAQIDVSYVEPLGVSAKGFPALELLLFGEGEDPALVVEQLRTPEGLGAPRCLYAQALAVDIAARTETIATQWEVEFADSLALAGEGGSVSIYSTPKEAVDAVMNHLIDALYTMVKTKLDTPLGNISGTPPDPELLESRFSGATDDALAANLDGIWTVYHGDVDGPAVGLAVLLEAADADSDARFRDQFAYTVSEVDTLPEPASASLVSQRPRFQTARDEVDTLRRLLKLDAASVLGVTLALSDNDGD